MGYGYVGIFLLGLLGSASIIVPIPYTVALLVFSMTRRFEPLPLALAAGIGSAIGKVLSYAVGFFGRKFVQKKYGGRLDAFLSVTSAYGPMLVFIFALTPLPDDALFIPLGLLRYDFLKFFIPSVLGKIAMCLIIAYTGEIAGMFLTVSELAFSIVTIVLLVVIMIIMFKVDWEGIAKRLSK